MPRRASWLRCLSGLLGTIAALGCDGAKAPSAAAPVPAPAPAQPTPVQPATVQPASGTSCEAVSPRLASAETYVYAGIARFTQPQKQPMKQATNDGTFNVITLHPDGSASGSFFSARRGDAPSFSATDTACWSWKSEGAAPRRVELAIGGGHLEFAYRDGELAERVKDDKLRTERVYDRITSTGEAAPACPAGSSGARWFAGAAGSDRVAFVAQVQRGLQAVVLAPNGAAERLEIAVDGTQLEWSVERGCWSATDRELRVTHAGGTRQDVYAIEDESVRQGDRAYARAK